MIQRAHHSLTRARNEHLRETPESFDKSIPEINDKEYKVQGRKE